MRTFIRVPALVAATTLVITGPWSMTGASAAPPTCFGQQATIVGTADDDELRGTEGRDVIVLLGGDDSVEARGGDDLVCGGDGRDYLVGGDGDDKIDGGEGRDRLVGGFDADTLLGGADDDSLDGGPQADRLVGGAGEDRLSGGTAADELEGGPGADSLWGSSGGDTLDGGADDDDVAGGTGSDRVDGGDGDDDLDGQAGDDRLSGGPGNDRMTGDDPYGTVETPSFDDVMDGGPGGDTIVLWRHEKADGGMVVDLGAGTARGQGSDTLVAVESVTLYSDHADEVTGSEADNQVFAGKGDDVVTGLGGDDTFLADRGADQYDGGPGSDTVSFESMRGRVTANLQSGLARNRRDLDTLTDVENLTGGRRSDVLTGNDEPNLLRGLHGQDTLRGMAGDDVLRGGTNSSYQDRVDKLSGGPGDDLIDGHDVGLDPDLPEYRDQVDYSGSATGVVVDLAAGTATGEGTDTLLNVEDAVGSVHDDELRGTDGSNELNGNAGDDLIEARGGDDEIEGNPGDDTSDGGPGVDSLQYNLAPAGVTVDLGAGTASGQGTDVVTGMEDVVGTLFADDLTGDDGPNVIDGAFGEDVVRGGGGDDLLLGDRGDDRLEGGPGDDELDAGLGDDEVLGDAGEDHLWSTPGSDAHDGGADRDLLDLSLEPVGAEVDLAAGTAEASGEDTVIAVEDVLGTLHADRIRGDDQANHIDAGKAIDEVDGRGGDDVLFGGSDRNRDFIAGGEGVDTVDYTGASRRVVADLQAGYSEGTGNDVLIALENIFGSPYDDDLRGDAGVNRVDGGAGDDQIDLRAGDDVADGGDGTDTADGGLGSDSCTVEFAFACE